MNCRRQIFRGAAFFATAWLGVSVSGLGQEPGRVGDQRQLPETRDTYGTVSLTCYTLHAYDFQPFLSSTAVAGDGAGGRSLSGGSNFALEAPVHLPSGAVIDHLELEGCDTNSNAGKDVGGALFACVDGVCNTPFVFLTSGAPGCTRVSSAIASFPVDNQTTDFFMQVTLPVFDDSLSLRAVRVYYKLQVSAGPAVATFADVPVSSPQFKFVEALVSAGITAGCGGGNFCPATPVTRGQLAVFLASALGLHFPN